MSHSLPPDSPHCTGFTRELLNRVGDKWSILIVAHLSSGPMRFNEIKRAVADISQRMLTLTLKGLEKDGLVTRTMFPTIPPRVDYELTPLGHTLLEPVMALVMWSSVHKEAVEVARRRYEATKTTSEAQGHLSMPPRSMPVETCSTVVKPTHPIG